jgi:predicted RNA binding protein YcfA (HicA-like mRNA interferase family)
MSRELPVLKSKEVVEALLRAGFSIKRQTGSHVILYKSEIRRPLSIPVHGGDLPKGTLRTIIRHANLTVEEFLHFL